MSYSDWKEINVNVAQVLLDYDNPRVFIDNPTQENLLRFLIDEEDSIELANGINTNKGLPPAEKPVVILEDGKYVVVEGNRRISACKLLYNRSILSKNEFNKVPDIDSSMKKYLENLPVVLAPSRDAAEPFITSRHAGEKGIKRWSTIATTKRYINRYRKEESINHIARVMGETASTVRKGIRFFYFLEYVRNELSWTDQEKSKLEIFKMETTKLDRFLPFSKKAREILKIDFLPNQRITTDLPVQNFNAALKDIIERIYLHNEIDTRSTAEEVFDSRVVSICQRGLNTEKTDEKSGSGETPQGGASETPQGGSGETPQGGSGETPQGGSGETPQGGASETPQGGSGETPQGGSGETPQGGSGETPQGGSGETPQGGASETPQGGSGETPQGGASETPQGGSGETPQGGSGETSQGGSGETPQSGASETPQGGSGETPQGGSGETPQGGSGETSQGGSGETSQGGSGETPQSGTTRGATNLEKYIYLTKAYPFTNRYKVNKRINALIKELKSTKYKENRMGSMYLIRSLLETYTHEYIDYFVRQDGEIRLKGVAKDRTKRTQNLRELIFDPIKIHLKKSFSHYEEQIELIDVTFTENNNTAATKIINFYIHSQTQVPDYHELLDCWKKVSMILNCLDDILSTQNSVRN